MPIYEFVIKVAVTANSADDAENLMDRICENDNQWYDEDTEAGVSEIGYEGPVERQEQE